MRWERREKKRKEKNLCARDAGAWNIREPIRVLVGLDLSNSWSNENTNAVIAKRARVILKCDATNISQNR
jgi:hypothetical protein